MPENLGRSATSERKVMGLKRTGVWFFPTSPGSGVPWECECGEPLTVADVREGYCPGCDHEFVGTLMSCVRVWYERGTDDLPPVELRTKEAGLAPGPATHGAQRPIRSLR